MDQPRLLLMKRSVDGGYKTDSAALLLIAIGGQCLQESSSPSRSGSFVAEVDRVQGPANGWQCSVRLCCAVLCCEVHCLRTCTTRRCIMHTIRSDTNTTEEHKTADYSDRSERTRHHPHAVVSGHLTTRRNSQNLLSASGAHYLFQSVRVSLDAAHSQKYARPLSTVRYCTRIYGTTQASPSRQALNCQAQRHHWAT